MASPGPRYQPLLQLLATAETVWNASRLFFVRWDLTPSHFNILNLIHSQTEGLTQIELSRRLIMHRSNVTGLVDRLEARGLVRRADCAGDRRAYRVLLTPAGRKLILEILPHYYAAAEAVWGDVAPDQAQKMAADLHGIALQAEKLAADTAAGA